MEDQKSKNRKIFNILLFVFAAIVFYIHMQKQNAAKQNAAPEVQETQKLEK